MHGYEEERQDKTDEEGNDSKKGSDGECNEEESYEETEDPETECPTQLRRLTRVTTRSSYLEDYVLLAEVAETERILLLMKNHGTGMRQKEIRLGETPLKMDFFDKEKEEEDSG